MDAVVQEYNEQQNENKTIADAIDVNVLYTRHTNFFFKFFVLNYYRQ